MKPGDEVRNRRTGDTGIVGRLEGDDLYLLERWPNVVSAREYFVTKSSSADEHKQAIEQHAQDWPGH